jgi:hypothetical protein
MKLNIKKLQWELKNADPDDNSIYEKIYKEFKRIELELITDYQKGFMNPKKKGLHRRLNKLLANTAPYWIDEYTIEEKIKELEDEGAFA